MSEQERQVAEEIGYLDRRLQNQIDWHTRRALWNKRRFHFIEIMTLIAGAAIPLINAIELSTPGWQRWQRAGSAFLATIVVVFVGIGKLYKFQENWLNYRALTEVLNREKELYLSQAGGYQAPTNREREKLLVERVEDVLASQTSQFISLHRPERKESPA